MELESKHGFPGGAAESFVVAFDEDVAAKIQARVDGNTKRLIGL